MARQTKIPGTEGQSIKEIDKAAEAYAEAHAKRIRCAEREKDARLELVTAMKAHDIEVYRDESVSPALVVTLIPGDDTVRVHEADEVAEKPRRKNGTEAAETAG